MHHSQHCRSDCTSSLSCLRILHYAGPFRLLSGRSMTKSMSVMCCCDVQPHATGVLTACSERNEDAVQFSMAGVSDLIPEAVLKSK